MHKTKLINLYGGPGTGKSTTAAGVFAALKQQGANVELVREYVKNWAWEGRKIHPIDQVYLQAKQIRAESVVMGKVDFVVTDSPVLLSPMYLYYYGGKKHAGLALALHRVSSEYYELLRDEGHTVVNVFLQRKKPFVQAGRYENEEQARKLDAFFVEKLEAYDRGYKMAESIEEVLELCQPKN